MAFKAETLNIGEHDSTISGIDYTMVDFLDDRAIVLRDTPVYIPSGILGFIHRWITTADHAGTPLMGSQDWLDRLRQVAEETVRAAHIAASSAHVDWRKVESESKMRAIALASGYSITDAGELARLLTLITLAQTGETFVAEWISRAFSELPCFDSIAESLHIDPPHDLDGDLDNIERAANIQAYMSLVTRWPAIAKGFASSVGPGDMERRASVLYRLAAYIALVAQAGAVARVALLKNLLQSLPFEAAVVHIMKGDQAEKLYARADAQLKYDVAGWNDRVKDMLGPHAATHLGQTVQAYRFPLGMFRGLTSGATQDPDLGITTRTWGDVVASPPIDTNTAIHPQLRPGGHIRPEVWRVDLDGVAQDIAGRLSTALRALEDDVTYAFALRDEGTSTSPAVSTAMSDLKLAVTVRMPFIPTSSERLSPIISSGGLIAEISISNVGELCEAPIVPDEMGEHDARDLARFIKGKITHLRSRVQLYQQPSLLHSGTTEDIDDPFYLVHLPISPMHKEWPWHPLPLPFWELMPAAYLGRDANGLVKPKTLDGLAEMLGISAARAHEYFNATLLSNNPAAQMSVITALSYIGAILEFDRARTADELEQLLTELQTQGVSHDRIHPITRGFVRYVKWGTGHRPIAAAAVAGQAAPADASGAMFTGTHYVQEPSWIQLTEMNSTDRTFYLLPYSHVPVPGPLLAQAFQLTESGDPMAFDPDVELPDYPRARTLAALDGFMPTKAFARMPGRDTREFVVATMPAGTYFSAGLVVALRTVPSGLFTRQQPERVDPVEAIYISDESLLDSPNTIAIDPRPGKTSNEVPSNVYHEWAAYAAEPGYKL